MKNKQEREKTAELDHNNINLVVPLNASGMSNVLKVLIKRIEERYGY